MAGYFEKRRKRRAASDKRKETARAASLQAELNTLTGRTSPQGVAGQPASGDPNTWCSKLPEGTHATPAVANGCMYIRTINHLICVGAKK